MNRLDIAFGICVIVFFGIVLIGRAFPPCTESHSATVELVGGCNAWGSCSARLSDGRRMVLELPMVGDTLPAVECPREE